MSPLITSLQQSHSLSGIPSLQSLRNPYRNQDAFDLNHQLVSPIMSRSPSIASDRYSTVSGFTANYFSTNLQDVNPPSAYVAPFGATQVVSEHRAATQPPSSDDEGAKASKDDVQFSEPALSLVNTFLDQLLFSFLSTARSTSLLALKPAVVDVLKHRLARDAIASAEDELKELLSGGDEEEELNTKQNAAENRRWWDLELVWKRTRLRVMVYMRLGEMEDDDEERYVREEELFQGNERRFSQTSGLVSWAAAIFLTGVLEYVAEQTLQAAGNAAYSRDRRQHRSAQTTSSNGEQQPVVVEEHDVEKVALSPTLGRLWRTWRKMLRNNTAPATANHRSGLGRLSTESPGRPPSVSTGAEGSVNGDHTGAIRLDDVPEMDYPEHVLASNIPLPLGDRRRDVDEIEVPGLARDPDVDEVVNGETTPPGRRNSFTGPVEYKNTGGIPTPDSTGPLEQGHPFVKPALVRQRSSSVPTPARNPILANAMTHAPGAFPEESGSDEEQAETGAVGRSGGQEQPAESPEAALEKGDEAEPKADAAEMAAHKQTSPDVKGLLDKVVAHEPPEETADQAKKSESHGLLAGAVAGASAAAAAATAMVYGKEYDTYKPVEAEDNGGVKGKEAVKSAPTPEPAQSTASKHDADDWDTHKSLIDMKLLLGSGQVSKRSSARPQTPPAIARTSSDESRSSYTLGKKDGQPLPQQSPAKRQHMIGKPAAEVASAVNGIGIATSSAGGSTPSLGAEKPQARDAKKRPTKLHLPGTPQRATFDSPTVKKSESPKTPRESLESRSLSSLTDRPEAGRPSQLAPVEQPHTTLGNRQSQKRRSIPGVAFTSAAATPVVERNPDRQSWSAAVKQQREHHDGGARPGSTPAVPSVSTLHKSVSNQAPVQEHPVVQRMASLKRNERKSNTQADGDNPALTSASIRGPEDFDMFVQRVETVKYTLTPETVRDRPAQAYEMPRSPVELSSAPSVSRRRPINPSADPGDSRPGRSVVSKKATSAAVAVGTAAAATASGDDERRSRDKEKRRSVSKPPPRNVSAHRRSGLMAREPRVMTESTQDFADFIRSTGPSKAQEVKPVLNPANVSTTSLHSLRSAHINGASSRASSVASQDRTRSMTRANIEAENIPPVPPIPGNGKSSMQSRGATSAGNGNSELIDFIRAGPNEDGQHRISRSVAPFRSTMNSDQLQPMGDQINSGKPQGLKLDTNLGPSQGPPSAKSQRSTRQTPSRANPRASTVNSNASQTVHPAHNSELQRLKHPKSPASEAVPGRRRYRNEDPYAIDFDDEDDDLLTALAKNKRQEESLMDFLNNAEPPKDNAPRPLVTSSGAQARNMMNRARVNSMNSLRSANAEASLKSKTMQNTSRPRPGASNSARPMSGASTPTARMSNSGDGPMAPKPRLEARSPGDASKDKGAPRFGSFSKQSNTKDLADFLKNSGPEDDKSAPAPSVGRQSKLSPKDAAKAQKQVEKESILSKGKRGFFGKNTRKKTWLDMP